MTTGSPEQLAYRAQVRTRTQLVLRVARIANYVGDHDGHRVYMCNVGVGVEFSLWYGADGYLG